jgi:NAD(P)-dependent dehydrogenase (short-subunit alcohol dehydrogenase family)
MGSAVAKSFAEEGANVVVADIDHGGGEATVNEIRRAGGDAAFIRTDVSNTDNVQAMVAATVQRFGKLDILYNNAGIQLHGRDARAHELLEEVWDRTMAVNLRGLWLCSKYGAAAMLEKTGGSIIQVASPTGLSGCAPGYTAYSTSKGGVIALTRVMAIDYAPFNIRVNAIVPGATETPLIAELLTDEQTRANLIAMTPLGRLGTPQDMTGLAVFLASDDSAFCTGGIYMADGGLTAR